MANTEQDFDDAQQTSRKRQRISHDGAHISTSHSILPDDHGSSMADVASCAHAQALETIRADVDPLRQILTCKVCHRFMYEPYTLSCGHSYCYSCLCNWIVENRKRTCPDCRSVISTQPNPSFVIRELVVQCTTHQALLAEGETVEEHGEMAREEADIVAKDKANSDPMSGGLFRGRFRLGPFASLLPLHDPGDGVDRCPRCHWEVEDGYCNQCGLPVGDGLDEGLSDFDGEDLVTDDELDGDLENEHDEDTYPWDSHELAIREALFGVSRRVRNRWNRQRPVRMAAEEESEDSSEDEGSMEGFIANDDEVEDDNDSDDSSETSDVVEVGDQTEEIINTARTTTQRSRRRGVTVVSSDDEDESVNTSHSMTNSEGRQRSKTGAARSRGGPLVISSDSSSSEDGDEGPEVATIGDGGFSSPESESNEDGRSVPSDDDEGDDSDGEGGQTLDETSFGDHYSSSSE